MEVTTIRGSKALQEYGSEIAKLFVQCFGKKLPEHLWRRYYLSPYLGDSFGICVLQEGRLIGFNGLVRQRLSRRGFPEIDYLQSITTMIHPDERGLECFMKLGGGVESAGRESGVSFLLGFPNRHSYHPFCKLWGWNCVCETDFVQVSTECLSLRGSNSVGRRTSSASGDAYSVPYDDPKYLHWRLTGVEYHFVSVGSDFKMAFKVIPPATLDVIDVIPGNCGGDQSSMVSSVASEYSCDRAVMTRYHSGMLSLDESRLTPFNEYVVRLCALPLSENPPKLRLSLLLSDVY